MFILAICLSELVCVFMRKKHMDFGVHSSVYSTVLLHSISQLLLKGVVCFLL